MYLLNTKALNTPSIISLLSQYNVDIPKYHRDVDKIRSNFKNYVQKTTFKVINYQEAYDNKSVFHIDVKPQRVGLNNITDQSIKTYFARAFVNVLNNVKTLFNETSKNDWKFMIWIHNDINGFEAASGPPSKIDGHFLDDFLERVEQFITSADVHGLSDMSITVKGFCCATGGAITSQHRFDLFKKRSLIEIKNDGNSCFWHASIVNIHKNHQK